MSVEQAVARYAKLLTKDEKKLFDEEMAFSFIEAEKRINFLIKDNDHLLKCFIRIWFNFFKQNMDYELYCNAKRESNQKVIGQLESKNIGTGSLFGITELFDDWGYIHDIDFEKWLSTRRHLFFKQEPEIKEATSNQLNPNECLVVIPKGLSNRKEFEGACNKFFHAIYKNKYQSYKPKYSINGVVSVERLLKLDLAEFIFDLRQFNDDKQKLKKARNYSCAQIVQTIAYNPLLRYSFYMDKPWEELARESTLTGKFKRVPLNHRTMDGKIGYIKDLEKLVKKCIGTSIQGKFPAT